MRGGGDRNPRSPFAFVFHRGLIYRNELVLSKHFHLLIVAVQTVVKGSVETGQFES